jgi:5-methylcytosine-specific restriction enzyme subunit McrC
MKASDFFKSHIRDNNYSGYNLGAIDTGLHQEQFFCEIDNESALSTGHRKQGIVRFISEIHKLIASKKISDLGIVPITFDDEFEANIDQKIFDIAGSSFDDLTIFTGNIVGSVVYKGHILNINCRFGNEFLKYMIANASGFLELENLGSIERDFGLGEWILTYYWKLQLKKAFALGIYKTYSKKEENLSSVRGNININSFLKKEFFDGKTLCNYKEHSYNNELNSVISMALTKVFKSKFQSIVTDIYSIKNAFDSINTRRVKLNGIKSHRVINSYFKKYNRVFDLSLMILKDEFANVGEQGSEFSAFLFDISLLFEHHIRKLLKQKFRIFNKNKKEFRLPNGIYENNIFPDLIIDFGENEEGVTEVGIYDVKYKNFDFTHGVEREDRFQLVSYVSTHLAKYKVVECGVIFPLRRANLNQKESVEHQILAIAGHHIPFRVRFYVVHESLENQIGEDKIFIEEFGEIEQFLPHFVRY